MLLPAVFLYGCAPQFTRAPTPAPAPRNPPLVLHFPQGQACLDELAKRGSIFDIAADRVAAGGACRLTNGVTLRKSSAPLDKPAVMSCQLALSIDDFKTFAVQPAAEKYFHRGVALIRHFGAYDCRNIAGTRVVSQHATGRAIDIAGFDLDGGLRINVKDHWRGRDARAQFLHEVARNACALFNVVLTPDSNADHYDHIHLDIGPERSCAG